MDGMSDAEVAALVQQMAAGREAPKELLRVNANLYRRVGAAAGSGAAVAAAENARPEAGSGPLLTRMEIEVGGNAAAAAPCEEPRLPGQPEGDSIHPPPLPAAVADAEAVDVGKAPRGAGEAGAGCEEDRSYEEGFCFVCWDRPPDSVILECGHGGLCRPCANRVWARPPHECPVCRGHIFLVISLEEASRDAAVGHDNAIVQCVQTWTA